MTRAVVAAVLLSGCVLADATPAIRSAAQAEARLGRSGANALDAIAGVSSAATDAIGRAGGAVDRAAHAIDGVGALVSSVTATTDEARATLADARPHVSETLEDVAALTSEASAIASIARANVEDGWFGRKMAYVLAAGLAVAIIHGLVSAYRIRTRLDETLRHVRQRPLPLAAPPPKATP